MAIYKDANAVLEHERETIVIIRFLSGVLQGCPASGWLFNNALDPFLVLFSRVLENGRKGIFRACADDLSFSLSRLKHLNLIYPIYASAESFAGLKLHPKKCVIIPLVELTEECKRKVCSWLRLNVPAWADFQVESSAKLLGFYVGPGMGKFNWEGPLSKFVGRVKDIKSATASVALNAYDFNSRVSPVLSYLAQLLPLDGKHFMLERVAMHTVLRAPWNTFRHSDFFQLPKIGGPKLRSPNVACAAALFRTAAKTVDSWPQWIYQMKVAAEEHLSLVINNSSFQFPGCWDSPSYAHNLQVAFEGFSSHPKFKGAGRAIRAQFTSDNGGTFPEPGSDFFTSAKSLQKVVHSIMMKEVFPDTDQAQLKALVEDRCIKVFAPFELRAESGFDLDGAFATLQGLSGSRAIRVLKTWLNGWATSHRMHEDPVLDCLLGCDGAKDSFPHYVMCPHLFAFVSFFFEGTSSDPLIRIGLKAPSISSFKVICCVFSAYHALKAKVRCGQIRLQTDSQTKVVLRQAWSVFAEALAAEAGECQLSHWSFSLPKFVVFLNSDLHLRSVVPRQRAPPDVQNSALHEDPT